MPNHTSDQRPWFIESASGRESAKRDWYVWRDPAPDGGPPNNWQSAFAAVGSGWTFHEATGQYYLHSFTPQQPDLNWNNPGVEAAMHEVLRFWLNRGVDGFSREPTLQSGTLRLFDAAADVFCYERELGRRFLIALNFSSHRVPLALGDDASGSAFLELSTHPGREHGAVDLQDLVLEPDEGLILQLSKGGADRS